MTDFDLTVVPVVDEEQQILGVITVDDVLEARAAARLATKLPDVRRRLAVGCSPR